MRKAAIILLVMVIALGAQASHNRAGEIIYRRIPPYTSYTYSITLIKYSDHGVSVADRCADTLFFGDGTREAVPRINGNACSACQGKCGELILNVPGFLVKKNIYSTTHTYPGPGKYLVYSVDPNRAGDVLNVPNSLNLPFYISSYIVASYFVGINSSPVPVNPPVSRAALFICFNENGGAVDPDGDSLSYELTPSRGTDGSHIPGYFYPQAGQGGTFTIHPVQGQITWCKPQFTGLYNVAIVIREWRKDYTGTYQEIGYMIRDMQISVSSIPVSSLPGDAGSQKTTVYPNPATEQVYLDGIADLVRITDLYGREVPLSDQKEKHVLSIRHLPDGLYQLILISPSGTETRKLVVKH